MYSLKKLAAEKGVKAPKMLHLYRSFNTPIEKHGRLTDVAVMAGYGLRHPGAAFGNIPLGMKLAAKKRMEFKARTVDNIAGFKKVMEKANELERLS